MLSSALHIRQSPPTMRRPRPPRGPLPGKCSRSSNVTTYPRADIAARSVRFAFGKFLQHRYVKHSKYGSKFFVAKANANILCSQPFHSMWFALGSANSFVERNQNVGRTVAENSVARVVISVEDSVGVRTNRPKSFSDKLVRRGVCNYPALFKRREQIYA